MFQQAEQVFSLATSGRVYRIRLSKMHSRNLIHKNRVEEKSLLPCHPNDYKLNALLNYCTASFS